MIFTAGNRGENVRSDCFVSLTILQNKENSIELQSKVKSLYGESIIALCKDMLAFFGVEHARLEIEDNGALPFTLAARIEAVINKMKKTHTEYLLPVLPQNTYSTPRDVDRVSRLYLPGNNPKLMINAGIYGCHGVILDLEDSVAPDRKFEARYLVRNALRTVDFYGAERMVRINQLPAGLDDLYFVIPHPVNLILIPKCENADQVVQTDAKISEILGRKNDSIHLMPIIENAAGVMNAFTIARASENIAAMAIGLEDYTADIGTQRSTEGRESFFARSMVVNAARAAGIQPIDSVFSDVGDMEGLKQNVIRSKAMGFDGMGCIHPRQIKVIHENFAPSDDDIGKAMKIVYAYHKATEQGLGVVSLGTKMIDPPVVKRALNTINLAVRTGKLNENWRDNYDQV